MTIAVAISGEIDLPEHLRERDEGDRGNQAEDLRRADPQGFAAPGPPHFGMALIAAVEQHAGENPVGERAQDRPRIEAAKMCQSICEPPPPLTPGGIVSAIGVAAVQIHRILC